MFFTTNVRWDVESFFKSGNFEMGKVSKTFRKNGFLVADPKTTSGGNVQFPRAGELIEEEIYRDKKYKTWYYFNEKYEGIDGIKVFVTYLLIQFDEEKTKPLNDRLLQRFYEFGNVIGKEALVVQYVMDHFLYAINYKKCAEFIYKFGLKPSQAPYMVFSTRPLEEIEDKNDIFTLSFKISDKTIFDFLFNSLTDYIAHQKSPPAWSQLISWVGRNSKLIKKIGKGVFEVAKEIAKQKI